MDPEYKRMVDTITLATAMGQAQIEHMLRALIEKGYTITRIENLKSELQ